MKRTFVQTATFASKAKRLGLGDGDIQALESLLMDEPEAGATVAGTGGVRKIRFAPPSWHTGKRGAARVIYAYVVMAEHVYFFTLYAKNEKADLTAAEKTGMQRMMAEIKAHHEGR